MKQKIQIDLNEPSLVLTPLPITEGSFSIHLNKGKTSIYQIVTEDDDHRKEIMRLLHRTKTKGAITLYVYGSKKVLKKEVSYKQLKENLTSNFTLSEIV